MMYSPSTRGFYCPEIHSSIPADAVDVTADDYAALMAGQANGGRIEPGQDGQPALVAPAAPTTADAVSAERETMRCSRLQARSALHLAGLLDAVDAAVSAADPLVQIAWSDAAEFRRTSPTIAAIATALGLSDDAVDDLFRTAQAITA